MIERQTRFTILLPNPDRQSKALIGRIGQAWQGLPKGSCRTVTVRPRHRVPAEPLVAHRIGTEADLCDPHSPWQKGAVENANGRIRRFLPGECNLAELVENDLASIVATLNATPRRCLGYRTPKEAFQDQLAALIRAA